MNVHSLYDRAKPTASGIRPDCGSRGAPMDWDDALPWAFLLFIAPFALSIRSIVLDRRLKAQIEVLTGKIGMLDHRIFRLDEQVRALAGGAVAPPPTPTEEPPPETVAEPAAAAVPVADRPAVEPEPE